MRFTTNCETCSCALVLLQGYTGGPASAYACLATRIWSSLLRPSSIAFFSAKRYAPHLMFLASIFNTFFSQRLFLPLPSPALLPPALLPPALLLCPPLRLPSSQPEPPYPPFALPPVAFAFFTAGAALPPFALPLPPFAFAFSAAAVAFFAVVQVLDSDPRVDGKGLIAAKRSMSITTAAGCGLAGIISTSSELYRPSSLR